MEWKIFGRKRSCHTGTIPETKTNLLLYGPERKYWKKGNSHKFSRYFSYKISFSFDFSQSLSYNFINFKIYSKYYNKWQSKLLYYQPNIFIDDLILFVLFLVVFEMLIVVPIVIKTVTILAFSLFGLSVVDRSVRGATRYDRYAIKLHIHMIMKSLNYLADCAFVCARYAYVFVFTHQRLYQ